MPAGTHNFPKIIHYIWFGDSMAKEDQEKIKTAKAKNPSYTVKLRQKQKIPVIPLNYGPIVKI